MSSAFSIYTNPAYYTRINADQTKAVLFAYDIHPRYQEKLQPVRWQRLDPHKSYRVKEINLIPGRKSTLPAHDKILSGYYLMKGGLYLFSTQSMQSRIVELESISVSD